MNTRARITSDGGTIIVEVPITFRRRGGRKQIISPDGAATDWAPPAPRINNTLVKAIARAFRWQELLESGQYGSITELAKAEKINPSYVARVLRLTLLAPGILESVVNGAAPHLTLSTCHQVVRRDWLVQKEFPAK